MVIFEGFLACSRIENGMDAKVLSYLQPLDCYLLSHDAVFRTTVSAGRAECVREMLRWQKR